MTPAPLTASALGNQLRALGVAPGMTVLVHASLSRLGWVIGGTQTVIATLLDVLGPDGTLMMPAHSADWSEPSRWQHPPVDPRWFEAVRAEMPAWDPERSPTRGMGALAEAFRHWPGVSRSHHPQTSFSALGPNSAALLSGHAPGCALGDQSPLGALYRLDGHVLLLGVGHGNNTSLHLAETRAEWPGKTWHEEGAAMRVDGSRRWLRFRELKFDDDDFETLGQAWEAATDAVRIGAIGTATCRLLPQRLLVDWATDWIAQHRS